MVQQPASHEAARLTCARQNGTRGSLLRVESQDEMAVISVEMKVRNEDKDATYWIDDVMITPQSGENTTSDVTGNLILACCRLITFNTITAVKHLFMWDIHHY